MLDTTQFAAANTAQIDALMSIAMKAMAGVEQLTALNLQVAKASLSEVSALSTAALSAKDPQALFALQTNLLQPAADKLAAYGQQVKEIVTSTTAQVEKVATAQAADVQKSVASAIEAAMKNVPEGSGNGADLFKTAMAAANNAFEGIQKAGRQATEAAEANFAAVTRSVTKAKRG